MFIKKLFKNDTAERWLVAGLGNPGKEYEQSRHNIGFMALEHYADKHAVRIARARFNAVCGEYERDGKKVLLLKPMTYMNLSGNAVGTAAAFYKIPPERVIILCDDINIPIGTLRIRAKGSAGGHNGLKSVAASISSNDYPRVRIGVGDRNSGELADWVLGSLSGEDKKLVDRRLDDIAQAIDMIIDLRLNDAQSKFN